VTGFHEASGATHGRPVGVAIDPRGALIVVDDLSNTVWRVTPQHRAPAGEAPTRGNPGKDTGRPHSWTPY
jgi:hypothetical protein